MYIWFIIIILVALLIFFIVKSQQQTGLGSSSPQEDPMEIAKRRYARGEITREEFEKIKRDLQ